MNSKSNRKEPANINPLMIPLLAAMETAINQLFKMDPETFKRLTRFKGKIIAFHLSDINQNFYFSPIRMHPIIRVSRLLVIMKGRQIQPSVVSSLPLPE